MNNDLLTVKEFSKKANVSVQSIYKRINNKKDKIQKYIVIKDNTKYIKCSAIEDIYNKPIETNENVKNEKDEIIELLKQQLEEKDKQINSLLENITDLNKSLTQQQQLNYIDKQKILALESAEETKKKGIFNIFKKRGTKQE